MYQKCWGGVRLLGDGPCAENVRRLDMNAIPMISAMQNTGLQVDLDHFARMEKTLTDDLERITEEVRAMTGYYINIDSGDQVADLLFKKLGLKQARIKMTASGDRESVEDQVLTAIQHDHPVVPKLQDYKEFSKLKGTYVVPMPKLAKRVSFGVWRMFPNLSQTRIPSSRLNCKDPNLLAMPTRTERGREIRKGFIAGPGRKIVSIDECFHPATLVQTVLGPKAISEIVPGDKVLTHRENRIKWGEVTASSPIKQLPAWKLTFDNGESVIASYSHKWPVQTPRRHRGLATIITKTTAELRIGERMVPCKQGTSGPGHLTWYSNKGHMVYTLQHHIVAGATMGPTPYRHEIHHRNEDKTDNDPNNLEFKLGKKHKSDHATENYKKQDHTLRVKNLRAALKGRRKYNGASNPNARLKDGDWQAVLDMYKAGMKNREIAEHFGLTAGYVWEITSGRKVISNHKLIAKEFVGFQPMHAITVEPDHNYVLACGVVTYNSQIEPRLAAHRSMDPGLLNVYRTDQDIYSDYAISAFRLKDERYYDDNAGKWKYPTVDPGDHRRPCKTCVLAALYGVTNVGLLEQMPVVCKNCNKEATKHDCGTFTSLWNEDNCQDLLNSFFMKYPGLVRMMKLDHATARKYAYIWDLFGRILHVAAVRSVLDWVVSAALREVGNFPLQSSAQGTIKLVMAQVFDEFEESRLFEKAKPLLQVHDELIWEVEEGMAEEVGAYVGYRFENCVRLEIPIKAGIAVADTWGDLEK